MITARVMLSLRCGRVIIKVRARVQIILRLKAMSDGHESEKKSEGQSQS